MKSLRGPPSITGPITTKLNMQAPPLFQIILSHTSIKIVAMPQKLELLKNPPPLLLTMIATEEEVKAAILLPISTEIIDQNSSNFKQDIYPYYKYIKY
jgi:hypothetical protein